MPGACKQRVCQTLLRAILEQRRGQPQRLEPPNEPSDLPPVSLPPRIIGFRARPIVEIQNGLWNQVYEAVVKQSGQETAIWIGESQLRPMLFPPLYVPHVLRRQASDNHPPFDRIRLRRTRHPVQKRLPDLFRLPCVQSLREHADDELVVGIHARLLSPMVIEKMLRVETHELADQALVVIIRCRLDREVGGPEELRKVVSTHCHLTHHAVAAASAAFQCPEQIRVSTCIRDTYLAVRRDYFGLQQ